jgi:uncharacterized protein YkwD
MDINKILILILVLILGCSKTTNVSSTVQKNLLENHNKERVSRKIKPLNLNQILCDYAQKHAEKMAKSNNLYHSKMSDLSKACGKSTVAENIAWGQENEKSVVNGWMKSTFHRWNILEENYSNVGFGYAKDKNERIYWCAVFSN